MPNKQGSFSVDDLAPATPNPQKSGAYRPEDVAPILTPNPSIGTFLSNAAPVVPEVLAIGGGFAGGPAGAGLGSIIGTELQNEFPSTFGESPKSLTGILGRTAIDTALGGGIPNAKALGPIGKAVFSEMKASGLPEWKEMLPWGIAGEVSGAGWHNGLKAGLAAKYGPAAYRGVKQGVQNYRGTGPTLPEVPPEVLANQKTLKQRYNDIDKYQVDPSINPPEPEPAIQPIPATQTPSGRVPGSMQHGINIQKALEQYSNEPTWKQNATTPQAKLQEAMRRISEGQQ